MIDGDYMNNKGFAISTLVYGLSIMGIMLIAILMGIMAVNRSNNRVLSSEIEKELNKFSNTEVVFTASNSIQTYEVPSGEDGWYRIELWGAAGGTNGGKGAYTTGVIELSAEDQLYFYVGKMGSGNNNNSTDVRLINDSTTDGIKSRIMVAAGGGRNAGSSGGTLNGYNSSMVAQGGKLKTDSGQDYSLKYNTSTDAGTLMGNLKSYSPPGTASFISSPTPFAQSNGGSGFYSSTSPSVGGISYIAGYAGCKGYNVSGVLTNNPGLEKSVISGYTNEGNEIWKPKMYYFVDGMMFPGVNSGDGKAKIERVVKKVKKDQVLIRKNTKLNGVSTITDTVQSPAISASANISAVYQGRECVTSVSKSGNQMTASINTSLCPNLDEIAVWHGPGKDYVKHTIKVNSTLVKGDGGSTSSLSETETPTGYRISAYQPDSFNYIKSGNYYILPVLNENEVFTAQSSSDNEHNAIKIDYIGGYKRQKWQIQLNTNPKLYGTGSGAYVASNPATYEYRILELGRFRAMDILKDENIEKNEIGATNPFNINRRNVTQIWKVIPVGNGTFIIKTARPKDRKDYNTGYIYAENNINLSDPKAEKVIRIAKNNNVTERFRLISVDYSSTS